MIGVARQRPNVLDIVRRERRVGDIGNPPAGATFQDMRAQPAKRLGAAMTDIDRCLVSLGPPDRTLGGIQPRSNRKAELCYALGPDIDAQRFLQGERQARNVV